MIFTKWRTGRTSVTKWISRLLSFLLFFNFISFSANAVEDISGPVIESIEVNMTSATVGDTITYTIKASDVSGLSGGYILLKNGESISGLGLTLQSDGSLIASKKVDNSTLNGSHLLSSVSLSDAVGNYSMYSGADIAESYPNLAVTITGSMEDTAGPEIASISVNKSAGTVGDTISYSINVLDDSDIEWASITLSRSGNLIPLQVQLQGNKSFTGTLNVNNTLLNGVYEVYSIVINDTAGNQSSFSANEIDATYPNLDLTITGSLEDADPPIIESISIDKREVAVGEIVTYTVYLNEKSGLASSSMSLSCGSSIKDINLVQQSDGSYLGIVKVDSTFVNGTYDVDYIGLDDIFWNHAYYTAEELESINSELDFTVSGSVTDTEGPSIEGLSVDKKVVTVGESITYSLIAYDESEYSWGYIQLVNGEDSKFIYLEIQPDGSIKGSKRIDNSFLNSTYEIGFIYLYDSLSNEKMYSSEELSEYYSQTAFTVNGSSEDGKIQGLAAIGISGVSFSGGDEITVDFDWTGEQFHGISLNFINFDANSSFNMYVDYSNVDSNNHVHFTERINEYSASGIYILDSVYVHDENGDAVGMAEGNVYECSFEVNNPNQDIVAPELITDTVSILQTADELLIDIDCIEIGSGLIGANFSFYNQYGDYLEIRGETSDNTLKLNENGYRITKDILSIVPSEYTLESIYLYDAAFNFSWYENLQLQPMFFEVNMENRRIVTFDGQDENEVKRKAAYVNSTVKEPIPMLREGYNFAGWYLDPECTSIWNFTTDIVTSDITLYAKWVENTPVGNNVEVMDTTQTVSLVFDNVTSSGKTTVQPLTEPDDESFFHIEGSAGFFDINSTAQFEESVKIAVKYDPELLSGDQLESELRLYQFKDGIPIDITDPDTPVDTENNMIYGIVTDHFCVFSAGLPENNPVDLTYTGSSLYTLSDQKVLSSKVTSSDLANELDYTKIYVVYTITDSMGTKFELPPVQCNENGIATITAELGVDVYNVEASILKNGYAAPASDDSILVVYDPTGGFVTGGGWINSPVGALTSDELAEGKANFGFVSKYKKGSVVPEGNTEFQFRTGNLNFHSDSYEWLVVNKESTRAQYKGVGTVNGTGQYKFMIWATDNGAFGDSFRIKIWNAIDENDIIYDNGSEQVISGGQISVVVK